MIVNLDVQVTPLETTNSVWMTPDINADAKECGNWDLVEVEDLPVHVMETLIDKLVQDQWAIWEAKNGPRV